VFDPNAEAAVNAHQLIRQPRNDKKGQKITAPIVKQKTEIGDDQNQKRDPMAEAVFAGKNV
jgi:hypothetical protein